MTVVAVCSSSWNSSWPAPLVDGRTALPLRTTARSRCVPQQASQAGGVPPPGIGFLGGGAARELISRAKAGASVCREDEGEAAVCRQGTEPRERICRRGAAGGQQASQAAGSPLASAVKSTL